MSNKKWKMGQIFVAFSEYLKSTALTAQVAQNCFMNLKVDLSLYVLFFLAKALLSKLYNVLAIAVLRKKKRRISEMQGKSIHIKVS